jgi:EAL domain-containing protein (putative c-di-GMP-specific phosphodiesterase class I)
LQVEKVREAGCREVQGYVFSKPCPAAEIAPLCDRRLYRAGADGIAA